jgi:NADH-quinone oxidoreductase subunit J
LIVVFYISALVAIVSTVLVVTSFNAIHALLHLAVSFLAVGVIFFILGAPLAAALEVIMYAGAILVLFVFVIMIVSPSPRNIALERAWFSPRTWLVPVALVLILGAEFVYLLTIPTNFPVVREINAEEVGVVLLGPYMLGIEIASFLLFAGLVGAYHLGYRFGWHTRQTREGK